MYPCRHFSRLLVSVIFVVVVAPDICFAAPKQPDKPQAEQTNVDRPNVVVFLIDDLGWSDLGCYGAKFYETPRIDKLAQRSVRFTSFYSAHPVCSPTRAALMTGKAPQRVGITQWIPQPSKIHLPQEEFTIGEAFSKNGYQTGYIGKWHLGEKDSQLPGGNGFGWQRCVNRAGQPASYFFPYKRKLKQGQAVNYWDVPDCEDADSNSYLTDVLTNHALDFIAANKSKPFFLCVSHYAVHTPIESPGTLVTKFKDKKSRLDLKPSKPIVEKNNSSTRSIADHAAYAAMLQNLDSNVGKVLEQLERLELTRKTIVVFTSDNGGLSTLGGGGRVGPTCNLPLRAGKGWNYEGGIRIPTLISAPGIDARVCDTPAITMDLYPTLLELSGLNLLPKQHLDGASLKEALNGKRDPRLEKRFLAWHYPHRHGSGHTPSSAIRMGKWKLIQRHDSGECELYDLSNDSGEKRELSKEKPEIAQRLGESLKSWVEDTSIEPVKGKRRK